MTHEEHTALGHGMGHRHDESNAALEPGELGGIVHDTESDRTLPQLAWHLTHLEEQDVPPA